MTQWTDSARLKLEEYLEQMRRSATASGADPQEVIEDIRRHVDEEIAGRQLGVVTERDIQQILARLGMPETPAGDSKPSEPEPPRAITIRGTLLICFGVILPILTLAFELVTGACAGGFFDPIPTYFHVGLVAFVPLANLMAFIALWDEKSKYRSLLAWANGCAIAIALAYAVLYLPLTPFAIPGIIFFGLGLLVLAPLLSFICAVYLRGHLRKLDGDKATLPQTWKGVALGLGLLAVVTVPSAITFLGLDLAASSDPRENTRGTRLLRCCGDHDEILRACYGRGRGFYSFSSVITPETARLVYYRVYGKPFNSVPPPKLYLGRSRWNVMEDEFTWDNDQGRDAVAGRVKGLTILSSRQDGFIDAPAGLAYTEWTLEFKNTSRLQREARAQIALPPGASVSRLTLWINGEEREAAFGGSSQVKAAYKAVVQRRRDPVLVTVCGQNRVLMQCFPVPPDGGTMKVRLGITSPLPVSESRTETFVWPHFVERNFSMPDQFEHSLWVDSSQPVQTLTGQLKTEAGGPRGCVIRGKLADPDLANPSNIIRVKLPSAAPCAWTRDTREGPGSVIRQSLVSHSVQAPERVVVVVDGTKGMEHFYPAIKTALSRLPIGIDFALLLARDGYEEFIPIQKGTADLYQRVALWKISGDGGHDNVPALNHAWELAAQSKAGAIVWIHGPQPVLFDSTEELQQRFERSFSAPVIYDVQTKEGPNRVAEKFASSSHMRPVLRLGELGDDLGRFFGNWSGSVPVLEWIRERIPADSLGQTNDAVETSMHLARLWAADEVVRQCHGRHVDNAIALAARYQLVTRVTGAVVLESQAQYNQAGLEPVSPDSVPTIPEPSTVWLVILGLLVLWAVKKSQARSRKNSPSQTKAI